MYVGHRKSVFKSQSEWIDFLCIFEYCNNRHTKQNKEVMTLTLKLSLFHSYWDPEYEFRGYRPEPTLSAPSSSHL